MGIKCPKCQSNNPDTQKFCGECATPLPSPKEIPVTETLETPKEELSTGSTFASRYQIIEELGKGGMGKVYKAHDTEIKEKVALKLLKPEITADEKTIERFRNEIRLARKIVHKNVGRMYDLSKADGTYFITMEYIEGQDLRGLIRQSRQLTVGTTINIAKQVSEGLAEAHKLGVVHRDLKPSNVMIDKQGNARIMDFGIARSVKGKGITGAGVMIGTPEYMSPEQVEVKEVDQRSDIYSLGVILYEMVTGRVPFEGETPLGIAMKHKSETPKDPRELNAQISEDLSRMILRCMEKDKGMRYQSAEEVHSELINLEKGIPTTERIVPKRKPITSKEITVTFGLKKLFIPTLVVVALIIAAVVIWQILSPKQIASLEPAKPSIAVLPFVDLSTQKDQEYFCDGMTDEIIAKLSKLKDWRVIPRTSMMRYKRTDKDIKEIGQELDVSTILEGSIRKEGDDIRVNAKLIRVEDSNHLWSDTYEKKLERVFDIQNDVAEKIAEALMAKLSPEEKARLGKKLTENLEAYNLYLKGRYLWNKRTDLDLKKAIEYFENAIKEDPNFTLAYVGLADSYNVLPDYGTFPQREAYSNAKKAALKALEIDESVAEAHASIALVNASEWDWVAAEKRFKQAIELNPNYAHAHHWYALYLAHMARFDEAIEKIKQAKRLDPLALVINKNVGWIYYFARQYDKALDVFLKTLELEPNFSWVHIHIGQVYIQKSMYEEALKEFKKENELSRGLNPVVNPLIGVTYALMGRKDEAHRVLNELIEKSKHSYVSPTLMALVYLALGDKDQCFNWLNKAYKDQDSLLRHFKEDPLFDGVRTDRRFRALLKRMGLEK